MGLLHRKDSLSKQHSLFEDAQKAWQVFAGRMEYEHQVPGDQSLLHSLLAAKRRDNGWPLSESQICAQSFTFILAGLLVPCLCMCVFLLRIDVYVGMYGD